MVLLLKVFIFVLIFRNSFSSEESERRGLLWSSNKSKTAPLNSNAGNKSSPAISAKKPAPSGSVLNNVRQGVLLSKEGTYTTVIPKFTALSNQVGVN